MGPRPRPMQNHSLALEPTKSLWLACASLIIEG